MGWNSQRTSVSKMSSSLFGTVFPEKTSYHAPALPSSGGTSIIFGDKIILCTHSFGMHLYTESEKSLSESPENAIKYFIFFILFYFIFKYPWFVMKNYFLISGVRAVWTSFLLPLFSSPSQTQSSTPEHCNLTTFSVTWWELLWPLPATALPDDADAEDQNRLCMRPCSLSSFPAELSAALWPPFQI